MSRRERGRWLAVWALLAAVELAVTAGSRLRLGARRLLSAEELLDFAVIPAVQTGALAGLAVMRRRLQAQP
ncbi:MAG TPA: hypothetical protein VHR45_13750 [Thermoanaerobaculia bacterium]|nr:hypothetical protein [Thermoanaerobaculia bacterium]